MREMRGVFIIGKTLCLCIKCFLCVFSEVTLSQYRGPHMNISFSPSRPVAADTLAFVIGKDELNHLPLSASKTRSEEHTSELQSLMRNSYAVFCWKKKTNI